MMSGGGSSLNGILETEKVKREKGLCEYIHRGPHYKATKWRHLAEILKKTTVRISRKVGQKEKEGPQAENRPYVSL